MRGFVEPQAETVEWYTPPEIFERLGIAFDLDPCSPSAGVPWIPVRRWYDKADDGLCRPWWGRVWLNPPYGRQVYEWMHRMAAHGDGMALVFARTDTGWFHETVGASDAICFLRGRLRFVRPDGGEAGTSAAPSVLVAYGDDCVAALEKANLGLTVRVDAPVVGQGNLWAA